MEKGEREARPGLMVHRSVKGHGKSLGRCTPGKGKHKAEAKGKSKKFANVKQDSCVSAAEKHCGEQEETKGSECGERNPRTINQQ